MTKKLWINCLLLICFLYLPLSAETKVPQRIEVFETACNTYIYIHNDGKTAILIDPGSKSSKLEEFVKEKALNIVGIINTHGHGDHIYANKYYADLYQAKVYAHPGDKLGYVNKYKKHEPTDWLDIKEEFLLIDKIKIKILQTPGHSQGSIGLLIENFLFSGDTLFHEGIGRTCGKDKAKFTEQELDGIRKKFFVLPGDTLVFPGHGQSTTIKHEIENNPFLK